MKPWYQSRTIWVNVLSLIIALAALFAGDTLGLPPDVVKYATIVLAVANVVLRTVTSEAIAGTPAARAHAARE